jgi:Tfp pilus assembly protein PilO
MNRVVAVLKRVVLIVVLALVAADAMLLLVVWRDAAEHSAADQKNLERLRVENGKMSADVGRAQAIRAQLPAVQKDCEAFFSDTLLVASSGYSTIVSDLGKIAAGAGLPPGSIEFKQKPADKQGIIEVEVSAAVEGNYSALVKFVNGLERSKNLYLLDALSLKGGTERAARLSLVMRTYFRS